MDTMAYVIWRVFMKKYSKIRLGVQRNISVNPAQAPVDIGDGKWGHKSATLPATVPAKNNHDTSTSKGTSKNHQKSAITTSKCSLKGDEHSKSQDSTTVTSKCADMDPEVSATVPPDILDKDHEKSATVTSKCADMDPEVSATVPPDILDKDHEKSATVTSKCADMDPEESAAVPPDILHREKSATATYKSNEEGSNISIWYVEQEKFSIPETPAPCTEKKGDVASLVDRHFAPMYPSTSMPILIRQARDLLVCTYHGNLQHFEEKFCRPAAKLIHTVREHTLDKHNRDDLAPRGWPLTLAGRVVLHLGQLDPTLLRNRDCYLCVDHDVRVVLVWKWDCAIHSRDLEPSSLLTPLVLEMAVSEADDLPGLLQALLVSVERTIERVPLDELSFPCPRCALEDIQDGRCSCPSSTVQKKDTSIQTSPMFEVVGSIPHIDSDEDSGEDCENHKVRVAVHSVTPQGVEEQLVVPTSIADIPDRVLSSGVCLPGTHDLKGRPLVLYDVAAVHKASLSHHQIATLLAYYCSLPSRHRLQDGITILVQLGQCAHTALDVLDRSLVLASKHVKIASVLLSSPARWQRSVITLSRSRIQCRVVSEQSVLREHIAEDQMSSHDQTEWLHFYKELEPFLALCQSCGRRLVSVMTELRASEVCTTLTRRQLHHQHKALSRALGDADLQRLRRDGPGVVSGLEERARWLPASEDVRLSAERARSLFEEVDRAARRLEMLWEGRRERIRDLARVRALEDETEQVLSWLCKKGEETLRRHTQLATNLSEIKEQEQDFERFYFISMRHLDKGSDLLEEAGQQNASSGAKSGLRDLARSLKQHLRGFSERLEDTRERLEDTSRCFYLLDKAYEWALETMKYVSQLKTDEEQMSQLNKQLQQYLMAHPPIAEDHFTEMLQLAQKLGNEKLLEQAKVAQGRCQEAMEAVQSRAAPGEESECHPLSPSVPVGRRRSLGSFPYIYKCSHHAAGHACSCWDPTPSTLDDCTCGKPNNLSDIREVRESAEDLLEGGADAQDNSVCSSHRRHQLRRACTWQCEDDGGASSDSDRSCVKSSDFLEEQDGGASSKPVAPVSVNSHLHCRASSLDLHSVVPPGKELKTHKTVLLIMREMIQTERDYVKSLEYIIEYYIPELLREDIPQALRGQRNVIFGNVEKIYEFHSQYFLQELQKCENSPLQVGQCFLRHEKKFYLYALYNKNKPKSDSLMSEYGTAFFKTKQMELGDKMDLASYLLKPVQRMGKYALLLQQLMKAYPDNEVDVSDIKAAETMVRFQLRHGNDLLAMDSLRDCDVNVKEQGRLLRQNEFLVWQGKGKKCLRHVFLFEELILFSKARRFPDRKNLDLYIYKNSIKMTDIGLTAKIGDSPTKFEIWFRKRKPNDTFTLQSMSEEIKQAWTEEISKLLWKQALKNREMRLAEMSSMGIGNKPCLDIRPSADQISDRSISIAQLTKTAPRFRNSISVSSGELLQRTTKRPHSIISVSSSSSSGGSSNSGYGALINLESPRMHHRSTTLNSQCSTESGIIADISLGSEADLDGSGSSHWLVERSNSSVTSISLDSSLSPSSPMSPSEEEKSIVPPGSQDCEAVTVKL